MGFSESESEKYILIRDLAPSTPYTQGYLSLLARRGKVGAIKVGKSWHINPKSLEAYMATTDSPASIFNKTFSSEPHAELASLSASAQAALYPPQFVSSKVEPVPQQLESAKKIDEVRPSQESEVSSVSAPQVDSLADALDRHFKSRGRLSRFNYFAKKTVVIPWAATAVLVGTLTVLFLFVDGFSFGKVDAMALRIKQAVEDSQTLQGYMPGTHANEVLLLDDEGKISIYGHIETQGQIRSLAGEGMAPLVVDSTVTVENLSADYVDGFSHEEFTLAFVTERGNVTTERVFLNGGASVGGSLEVSGATKLLSYLEVYGELHALSNAIVDGALTVNDDIIVGGEASFLNNVVVDGSAEVKKNFTALSAVIKRSLTVEESAYIEGNFGVGGDTSIADLDADDGDFSGDISANDAQFSGSLTVTGNASFSGVSLSGSGTSTFSGNLSVAGDGYYGGDLEVVGNLNVGSISLSTLGVTGTSTARRYLASDLGNETAAAYSFTGDTDTGIFSAGADTLNFTAGGVSALQIDSSQDVTLTDEIFVQGTGSSTIAGNLEVSGDGYYAGDVQIDGDLLVGNLSLSELTVTGTSTARRYLSSDLGSETAAAYSFSGDTDTGIYSAGPNILSFTTAGVTRFTIDASGNVTLAGTGTSTAAGNLDLAGDFNATRYDITGTGTSTNAGNLSVSGDGYFGGNVQIVGNLDVGSLNLSDLTVTGTSTARRYLASDLGNQTAAAYSFVGDNDTGVFSSGADTLNFTTGGTNRLSIDSSGNAAFTGTGTSTFAGSVDLTGDFNATQLYVTGTGTSTVAGNVDIVGEFNASRFDITGSGTSTLTGHLYTTGNVEAIGSMFVIGDSINDIVYINSYIQSDLVPFPNATYDLGTAARYWDTLYVDTINANTIAAASTSISGTINEDFTINSDNATADTEDMSLIFYRGTVVPNAVIEWDSTLDHFNFNHPVHVQNDSSSISSNPTFHIQGQINQTADIFNVSSSTGDILFTVTSDDTVGVATDTPGATFAVEGSALITGNTNIGGTLDVAGNVTFTGLSTFSDLRAATLNASSTTVGTLTGYGLAILPDLRASTLNASTTSLGSATLFGALTNTSGLSTLSDVRAAMLNATTTNVGTLTTFGSATIGTTLTATGGLSTLSDLRAATLNASSTTVGTLTGYGLSILPDLRASVLNASTTLLTSATTTNLAITGITGSTQCLQVDTNGTVTGAGSQCNSGAAWHELYTDVLTPTSTTAGIFVNASSTFDSTLRVNGSTELNGILSVTNTSTSSIAGGLTVDTTTLVVNDNENRVGIGTANPTELLHVYGAPQVRLERSDNANGNMIYFQPAGALSSSNVAWYTGLASNSNDYRIRSWNGTVAVDQLLVDNSGDVRIPDLNASTTLIGTLTTTGPATIGTTLTATGGLSTLSDLRAATLNASSTTVGTLTGYGLAILPDLRAASLNSTSSNIGTLSAGTITATGISILPDLRAASVNATSATIDTLTVNSTFSSTGTSTARRFLASDLGGATGAAFSFSGDPNTGIFSAGADQLNLATGGTTGFTLDSSQDVTLANELFVSGTATSTIAGGLTVDGNTLVVDANEGRVGIGTSVPSVRLSVIGGTASSEGILVQDVLTDAAAKTGRLKVGHYTNSEEPVTILIGHSDSTENNLYIGGFSNSENAMTHIRFLTAANNTTLDGTERMIIDENGDVGIATSTPGGTYGEKLTVVGGAYITGLSVLPDVRAAVLNASSTNLGTLNVYGATTLVNATTTNFAITGITGSTQCLQADTNGVVTGSGVTCEASEWLDGGAFVYPDDGDYAAFPYFTATSTTATSTIAHSLAIDTDTLVVNANEGRVGIGTANPATLLHLSAASPEFRIERTNNANSAIYGIYPQGALSSSNVAWLVGLTSNSNDYAIATWDGLTSVNRITLDNTGDVRISDLNASSSFFGTITATGLSILPDLRSASLNATSATIGSLTVNTSLTNTGTSTARRFLASDLGGATGAAFSFSGDPNTGIFSAGADTLNLSTGGTLGLTLDSNQDVTLANELFVSGTGTSTIAGGLTVDTSTLVVNANNNRVGIGTASPSDMLHISSGGASIARISGTSGSLVLEDTTDVAALGQLYFYGNGALRASVTASKDISSGVVSLNLSTQNQSDLLNLADDTGAVGIATTTPGGTYGEKLTVAGSAYVTGGATTTNLAITGISGSTQCLQADTNGTVTGSGIACGSGEEWLDGGSFVYPDDGDYAAFPYFTATSTTATSTIAHSLSIDTNTFVVNANEGRVGIGTSTPNYLLSVNSSNATDNLFQIASTTNQNIFTISSEGNVGIGVGNASYELEIRRQEVSGITNFLGLTSPDVSHGITSLAATDAFGEFEMDSTGGGLRVGGFSDAASGVALTLRGVIGNTNPNDSVAGVEIIGAKKNGTGITALDARETVLEVLNDTTVLTTTLGDGSFGLGTTTPGGTYGEKLTVVGGAYITGGATTTNLAITGITGSTQCLQADTNGTVTGAGSACGSGGEWLDAGAYVYPDDGDYAAFPYFTATSTTATSTIAHSLAIDSDTLVVNANEGRVYVGTTTPAQTAKFGIYAAGLTDTALRIQSSDGDDTNPLILIEKPNGDDIFDLRFDSLGRNPILELGDTQSAANTEFYIDAGGGNDGIIGFRVGNEEDKWNIVRDGTTNPLGNSYDLHFRRTTDGSTFLNVMTLANANTFVGIGTTTPDSTLSVVSAANSHVPVTVAGLSNDQTANLFEVGKYASSTPYLTIGADGALAVTSSLSTLSDLRAATLNSTSTNIGTLNVYGATTLVNASTTNFAITGITGSMQCLQADTNGTVTGTGSGCGGVGSSEWVDDGLFVYPGDGDYAAFPYFTATSTTATSTIAHSLAIDTNTLVVNANEGRVGIGTANPNNTLQVNGLINFNDTTFSTALGSGAGANLDATGSLGDTFVGYQAGNTATSSLGNTALGYRALSSLTNLGTSLVSGNWNTAVGYEALTSVTGAIANTAIGYQALQANIVGYNNVAIGDSALIDNTAWDNVGVGAGALFVNTTGTENVAIGTLALGGNTTGSTNVAVGHNALRENTTGTNSIAIGYQSLFNNQSSTSTIAIGSFTAQGTANYSNQRGVYIGSSAGTEVTTGSDENVFIGYHAGDSVTSGAGNVLLGNFAGENITTGSNNIILGYNVDGFSASASNQLNIGNLIFGNGIDGTDNTISSGAIGIATSTPGGTYGEKLTVVGNSYTTGAAYGNSFIASAAGGYNFLNDTDTSVYSSGANTLNLITGGLSALTIDSNQDVTLANELFVSGTGTSTVAGGLLVDTNTLVVNDNENRVGIGTTNPQFTLDVTGTLNVTGATTLGETLTTTGTSTARRFLASDLGGTGSAAFSFSGDPNTGIFSSGANALNLVTGGGTGLLLDANLDVTLSQDLFVSGTATSTFAGGLTVDTSTLFVNANENRVGVGTTTPQSTFVADGTVELGQAGLGHILFETTALGGTPTLIGIGTTTPDADLTLVSDQTSSDTYLLTVATTSSNVINRRFTVDSDGDIRYDGSASAGADYSEAFTVEGLKEEYEPGDIMVLSSSESGKVKKSSSPYEDQVVGVYSTKPGIIGTLAPDVTDYDMDETNDIPVGVLGRVPVKVTTENGPINIGDRITSSSLIGVGMKADETGMVIGRALESYSGVGVAKIMVMVDPMWFSGNLAQLIEEGSTTSTSTTTIINETTIVSESSTTDQSSNVPSVVDTVGDAMVNLWDVARETVVSVADSLWNVSNTVIASASKLRIFSQNEDGVTYETYNVQSARKEITISGTAELKRLSDADVVGARVAFDESFMSVIDQDAPLKVVVTPTSRIAGSLYVHEKQFYGFEVREQNGESEGATFDWIVIARAAGDYNEEEDPVVAGEQVDEFEEPLDSTDSQSPSINVDEGGGDEATTSSEPIATSTPAEPTSEPQPKAEPESASEISSEPLITPPASEPETATAPTPEPAAEPSSETSEQVESEPESTSEPSPEPEPTPAPTSEPEPEPSL